MYEYEVQGYYAGGWECVYTAESMAEARAILRDYRNNDGATPYRVRRVRVAATA